MTTTPLPYRRPDPSLAPEDGYTPDLPFSHGPWEEEGALSLASSRPGDLLRVREIFFGIVRDRCRRVGLAEGDVVECRDVGSGIRLRHGRAGPIVLDPRLARFVLVRRIPGEKEHGGGTPGTGRRDGRPSPNDPLLDTEGPARTGPRLSARRRRRRQHAV